MNNAKHFIEKTGKNWFSFADRAENVELDHAPQWATEFPQLVFVGGGELSGLSLIHISEPTRPY